MFSFSRPFYTLWEINNTKQTNSALTKIKHLGYSLYYHLLNFINNFWAFSKQYIQKNITKIDKYNIKNEVKCKMHSSDLYLYLYSTSCSYPLNIYCWAMHLRYPLSTCDYIHSWAKINNYACKIRHFIINIQVYIYWEIIFLMLWLLTPKQKFIVQL